MDKNKSMLETSRDILNLVLSLSVAIFVFFLCWALFYLIASARRTFRLIRRVEQGVEKAEALIDLIKEKVSSSASYLILLSNLVKKGMEFAEKRRDDKHSEEDDDKKSKKGKK